MIKVIKKVKQSLEILESLTDGLLQSVETYLGFSKLNHKREILQRDQALIERAWESLERGEISEFEIGDVRIVSAEKSD